MPATAPVTTEFTWDAARLRYRRAGKFVSARAVKLAVRRVIRNARAEMAGVTEQMIRGTLSVAEWQGRFSMELKNLHVSGAMAGQGGPASMRREDYLRVGRELKRQYRYLKRFAEQAAAGELSPARIRQRAAMYVNGMNGAHESGRQAAAVKAGYDRVRNVLGHTTDHCHDSHGRPGCVELTAKGWVDIGTMPLPGTRACLSGCQCTLKFGRAPVPETIVAAANRNRSTGQVVTGENHPDAYAKIGPLDGVDFSAWQEGFVTSRGRFVSRKAAARIAKRQAGVGTAGEAGLASENFPDARVGRSTKAATD